MKLSIASLRPWALVCATLPSGVHAATVYVDSSTGSNSDNGTTWALAKATIQAGIAAAQPNDTVAVRAGTYLVGGAYGSLVVAKNLTLLGGYTACDIRSPRTAPTMLVNMGSGTTTMLSLTAATTTVNGFRFQNGSYALGGAINATGGTHRIEDCWFSACNASLAGGAIYADGCTIAIERNRFSNNFSQNAAGAIGLENSTIGVYSNFFEYNSSAVTGGAIRVGSSNGSVNNNTFAYSTSASGAVLHFFGFSGVNFRNNIVRNATTSGANSGAVSRGGTFSMNLYNNLFFQVSGGLYSWVQSGNNEIVGDPLMSGNSLLHLTGASPAKDTGDGFAAVGTHDYDGDPRVQGSGIDRGADELRTGRVQFAMGCIGTVDGFPFGGSGTIYLFSRDEPGVGGGFEIMPSPDGFSYVLDMDLPVGTYEALYKGRNSLAKRLPPVELSESSENVFDITVTSGDVDGDNAVTIFDYNLLGSVFDYNAENWGWDEPDETGFKPSDADLDFDGAITVFDYGVLSANFDQQGDV